MLTQLAYFPLFGLPLIVWGGLTTAALLVITLILAVLNSKKEIKDAKAEKTFLAFLIITVIVGLGHGILGLLINLFEI